MNENQFVSNPIFYTDDKKDILISKSNTLIEAGFDLTLAEHDLMTLAINKLHRQGTGNHEVFITAKEFAVANKISESHAYQQLKSTADKLMERKIKFPLYVDSDKKIKGEPNCVGVLPPKHGRFQVANAQYNWLQGVAYAEDQGFIYLHFSDPLKFLIDKTGDAYTNYNYSKTIDMTSTNAKRLYELACKWKDLGKTKMMYIDEWKDFFGVSSKYEKVFEFKRWVLLPAIAEVNSQGDFRISLKQEKVGRSITHFQILIKKLKTEKTKEKTNPSRDPNTADLFTKMTDAQRHLFAKKMSEMPEMSSYSQGTESYQQFAVRIAEMLLQPEKFREFYPLLTKLGYK